MSNLFILIFLRVPVILSLSVGEEVDKRERYYYDLFPEIENFQSAMVFKEDSLYEIEILTRKGTLTISTDSIFVQQLRKYLDFFEEFKEDTFFVNSFQRKWKKILPKPRVSEEKIDTLKKEPQIEGLKIEEYDLKPPFKIEKALGELFTGTLTGIIFGVVGGIVGINLGEGTPVSPIETSFLMFALGCAVGVYGMGNTDNETGSFLATFGGSIVGALWGTFTRNGFAYFLGPPAGAVIGFNTTRKYKKLPPSLENGALNFESRFRPYTYTSLNLKNIFNNFNFKKDSIRQNSQEVK